MKRVIRERRLTPAEGEKYQKNRDRVAEELPELVARHHQRVELWRGETRPRIVPIGNICSGLRTQSDAARGGDLVKFSELVSLLEANDFRLARHKGSIRYFGKDGWPNLVRVDFHGTTDVPKGTCNAILKTAGIPRQ